MNKELNLTLDEIDFLLSPEAIRSQATKIFKKTVDGEMLFQYHPEKLKPCVEYVLSVIKKNYPDLQIPFHSRWGHFRAGQKGQPQDRVHDLDLKLENLSKQEKARVKLDLVITSVLLDAGAGAQWKYLDQATQKPFSRSEGLGLASLELFLNKTLSSDRKSLRADSAGLKAVTTLDIEKVFQVSTSNPLVGVEGRKLLLNNLGQAVENKKIFKDGRPGNILDYLFAKYGNEIPAKGILKAVLEGLGPIWPGRLSAKGINLGDIWPHSKLGAPQSLQSLVPFHKLSQWMTYSLIEPIIEAGFSVTGVEDLTGLAEYRNGGLILDFGLVSLKNSEDLKKDWAPSSDLVIEWRALTVYLLDQIGTELQKSLQKTPAEFPLAKILEGGTWWAGRFLAMEKRPSGDPPLRIQSDGTVF